MSKKPNKHPRLQQEIVDISSDSLRSPSSGPVSGSAVVPSLPTSVLQLVSQPAPAVATVTAPIVMPVVSPNPSVATVTASTQAVLSVENIAAPVGLTASVPTPPIAAHATPIAVPVVHPVAAPVVLPVALPTSLAMPVVTTVSASMALPDLQPASSSANTTIEPDRMAARKRDVSRCA